MGQKVHPVGIRLGIVKKHNSTWYMASKHYADTLNADIKARTYLEKALSGAFVSKIEIKRPANNAQVTIYSSRPGNVIGRKGEEIEGLRKKLSQMMDVPVHVNVEEVRKPEIDAKLVAESVAQQLARRINFRRAMKRAVQNALRAGAEGIKICVSGRLGGAEIARAEWYREGRVPLHTFRADIDYATARSNTTYGVIGVKVWIFKGEVISADEQKETAAQETA